MIPKYRAWSKDKEILAEVVSIDFWSENTVTEYFRERDFEDVVLMQSTGFTDDVGDELFENDIILWTYWDEFEDSGSAMIILENGIFKLIDTRTGKEVWDNLFDCIENCNVYLQGNTCENKELLEVTE